MADPILINRRDFIVAAGLAAAAGAWQTANAQSQAPAATPVAEWFDKPMRWAQLVLAEDDPGNYDAQFWLDYFKRIHADAACLSAGGCVCYYPTQIQYHHRSAWMKDGTDPFGDLVAGCRKMDMIVTARTDPHSILDDAAAAHPEWVAVDAAGNKRRHWAAPNRWVTCAFGPYNFDFMNQVNKEIIQRYQVDAIFANRWQGSGMCYCDSCKQQFRAFANMDLPRTTDPHDPGYRNYLTWSGNRLFELWRLWDGEIRRINPAARFIPNTGGGSMSTLDMVTIGQLASTLAADRQSRRGIMAPWAAGKNAKEFRATLGNKPVIGLAALGIDDDHRWKDSVINEAELRLWIANATANGARPWVAKFCGAVFDKRWISVIENVYDWHWKNEKYLRNQKSLARVAMVYSQQTGTFYGGTNKRPKVEDHELGLYHALVEARIPFEMVHDRLLDAQHIDRFKLLMLPNTAALSDAQCEQLRQYVRRGGSLLATFETSLYDELGNRRANFGLADLFGVSFAGQVQTDVKNSYIGIESGTKHPILRSLEDAGRIINTVQHVEVNAVADFPNPPLTRVPSYPDLPMEEVYPRVPRTNIPEVFLRQIGPSRIVYFPGDIERTFWEIMAVDHGIVLRNAIEWAMDDDRPATVTGPGLLDVTVWQQKDSMTVHLVNLTNPMMLKASYRELIPLGEQTVSVRLPPGKQGSAVKLLASGKTPAIDQTDGVLTVKVDSILDFEVVAVDLA